MTSRLSGRGTGAQACLVLPVRPPRSLAAWEFNGTFTARLPETEGANRSESERASEPKSPLVRKDHALTDVTSETTPRGVNPRAGMSGKLRKAGEDVPPATAW
jgi:hypothetical protein